MRNGLLTLPKTRFYLVFALICATMSASMAPGLWRLWRISEAPVAALGFVTGLDCPNHGRVDYTFEVAGATLSGASGYVEGADCRSLRVGQRVNVSYERGAPKNNYAFSFDDQRDSRARSAFFASFGSMAWFVFVGPLVLVFLFRLFLRISRRLRPA
jgi:hypothetical protein